MKASFAERLKEKIDQIEEGDIKDYLSIRYLNLLKKLEINTYKTSLYYYILSVNVTFGSLLMPPLLTIDKRETDEYFWSVFVISLIITTSNALVKLFHLDKVHITRNIRLNQFKSEGLYFLTNVEPYNHQDTNKNFKLFVKNIEKLKREQILEEYTQNREENNREEEDLVRLPVINV